MMLFYDGCEHKGTSFSVSLKSSFWVFNKFLNWFESLGIIEIHQVPGTKRA